MEHSELVRQTDTSKGASMKRLPKGKSAQVMGSRFFQTMYTSDQMRKYAATAVKDEREQCAKVCEDMKGQCWAYDHDHIAAAIRARGNT